MIGLALKAAREMWVGTLLFALALLLVERMLMFILPQLLGTFAESFMEVPFIRMMVTAMMGLEVGAQITAQLMQTMVWVHPVVLSLLWAHAIIFCTRFPVAEIDRGTIDVLLSLPVSRRRVFVTESVLWLLSGALIIAMGAVGYFWGAADLDPADRPAARGVALVLLNLYCLYVAVGAGAFLMSALCNRRGRAVAIIFAMLLASFLLNFLAQFWPPAERLSFLGVMKYYQPAQVMIDGALPLGDITVLLLTAGVAWTAAGEVITRRSICTV